MFFATPVFFILSHPLPFGRPTSRHGDKDILLLQGRVGTVFHLEDHGSGFQYFQRVPLPGGDTETVFVVSQAIRRQN